VGRIISRGILIPFESGGRFSICSSSKTQIGSLDSRWNVTRLKALLSTRRVDAVGASTRITEIERWKACRGGKISYCDTFGE
jgi:hypothetical protein